jgi:hypothetical protein
MAAVANGVAAALPFLFYYVFRSDSEIDRQVHLLPWEEIASAGRLAEFWERLHLQFGATGLVALALALAVIASKAWRHHARRAVLACLLGAAATQVAFFYGDEFSAAWLGYPRFHLIPYAILSLAAWIPREESRPHPLFARVALGAAALLAVLHAPPLAETLRLLGRPEPAWNFFEHDDAPMHYPIRGLIEEAQRSGALSPGARLLIEPSQSVLDQIPEVYPRLGCEVVVETSDCRCGPARPALLLPILYPRGIRMESRAPDDLSECIRNLRSSYERILERTMDGHPTALLGIGCKR